MRLQVKSFDDFVQKIPKDCKLKPIKFSGIKKNLKMIVCKCVCGKIKEFACSNIIRGRAASCGCVKIRRKPKKTFLVSKSKPYRSWQSMMQRCYNRNNRAFHQYGGRGIKVTKRWHNYANFIEDLPQADPDKFYLDRIDPNGNYEPKNCRWVDAKLSSLNRRDVKTYIVDGNEGTIESHSRNFKIRPQTVRDRIKKGWPKNEPFTYKKYSWQEAKLLNKKFLAEWKQK